MSSLNATLCSALIDRYRQNAARVRELGASLTNEQFWQKPFPFGNSFGHLVLHLTGNLNYYICAEIAKASYVRDRPREFNDPDPPSKEEALALFDGTVRMVIQILRSQTAEDWAMPFAATGTEIDNRLGIVIQCAAHMQHHIGQMIFLTYQLKANQGPS